MRGRGGRVRPGPVYRLRIRDLPADERPRERLQERGPGALSNAELLAILLRTGAAGESALSLAERLLAHFQGLGGLARATLAELCRFPGLGPAKACQVLAGLELARRLRSLTPPERPRIAGPADVAELVGAEMAHLSQEHLRVLLLNARNEVVRAVEVYVGNVGSAVVRPAEVFRPAVQENCPALIVVHNHPSGTPEPSADDLAVTRTLVRAGELLGIELLDHVVVAQRGWVSLKERLPSLWSPG